MTEPNITPRAENNARVPSEVIVLSYDESNDRFTVSVDDDTAGEIDGCVLPFLIGCYGEPSELVGRMFLIRKPE